MCVYNNSFWQILTSNSHSKSESFWLWSCNLKLEGRWSSSNTCYSILASKWLISAFAVEFAAEGEGEKGSTVEIKKAWKRGWYIIIRFWRTKLKRGKRRFCRGGEIPWWKMTMAARLWKKGKKEREEGGNGIEEKLFVCLVVQQSEEDRKMQSLFTRQMVYSVYLNPATYT